jgi:SulP family sulfate permease
MQSLLKFFHNWKSQWFFNIRGDLLAGTLVALALIPEAIAFSIIAGVDPKVGLYASFSMAIVIAFAGGRPAMISAATGAMALVMVDLIKDYGLEYLFAATILTGLIQILAAALKLGSLMRFVSKSVVNGFVNSLAILIFLSQLGEFENATWHVYALVVCALAIIYLFPYFSKTIPSPLVAILTLTAAVFFAQIDVRSVGDMGDLPSSLPQFLMPNVPFNLETLQIILPYSLTLAAVGLLESLMTAVIVDEECENTSNKNQECAGQGLANIATGFLGGMAGCAMIGQSIINVKSGARGRLSTFFAGAFLLFLIVVASDFVKIIPMPALVAVMIVVAINTFNWKSLKDIKKNPKSSSLVMLTTAAIVVFSHNLALGVFIGVLMSALFFARKVAQLFKVESRLSENGHLRLYQIYGQVFFASADDFYASFNFKEKIQKVLIDVKEAHFWDVSAVAALDKVALKFRHLNIQVKIIGLNRASETLLDDLTIQNKAQVEQLKLSD